MLSTEVLFYVCTLAILIAFYTVRSAVLQTAVLSIGSFAMYATEGLVFFIILCGSCVLTAVCSFIAADPDPKRARNAMIAGVVINLGVLVIFKYKQLLIPASVAPPQSWVGQFLALGLPIGISFYTFHGISLVVDAWHNGAIVQRQAGKERRFLHHFIDTSLYLSFFPQLVAGPITKGKSFFPQIEFKRFLDIPWSAAASDIIIGLFLKRVVADNLNQLTTPLTDARTFSAMPPSELIAMIVGYSAQIFADFAGYSLIAIGVAKLFGYQLPINFNQPYLSQSITEFWRRWHISLSSWLREYLYYSLGGNRRGPYRTYVNLLIVMGLGGLWHGADWKFALWGLFHGALLAIERLLGIEERSRGLVGLFRMALTFSLVTFGWMLFRLNSLSDVWLLFSTLFSSEMQLHHRQSGLAEVVSIWLLTSIVVLAHIPTDRLKANATLAGFYSKVRPYYLGFLVAVILMASGSKYAFIYFQF
jgi:alginate O-acetyltransferase complex protein AlgI